MRSPSRVNSSQLIDLGRVETGVSSATGRRLTVMRNRSPASTRCST